MIHIDVLHEPKLPSIKMSWLGWELNWPPRGEWLHWVKCDKGPGFAEYVKSGWFVFGPVSVWFSNGEEKTVYAYEAVE